MVIGSGMNIQFKLDQSEFFPRVFLTDAEEEEFSYAQCDGAGLEFQLSGDRGRRVCNSRLARAT